jgi:hypothetical protein
MNAMHVLHCCWQLLLSCFWRLLSPIASAASPLAVARSSLNKAAGMEAGIVDAGVVVEAPCDQRKLHGIAFSKLPIGTMVSMIVLSRVLAPCMHATSNTMHVSQASCMHGARTLLNTIIDTIVPIGNFEDAIPCSACAVIPPHACRTESITTTSMHAQTDHSQIGKWHGARTLITKPKH